MHASVRGRQIVFGTVLFVACDNQPAAPSAPSAPTIRSSSAAVNSQDVLSAVVSVHARNADSVAVRFTLTDVASLGDSITPAVKIVEDSAEIPVLGLLPSRRYTLRAIAYSAGGNTVGDPVEITTDALPWDIPTYAASGADPSPGYVVFAAGKYGLVIDNTGRVVWYHQFPHGAGLSFMAAPSGHFVAKPQTSTPSPTDPWVEIDILGNVTRPLPCGLGLQARPHDLIGQTDGSYWLMCDEVRTMDLTSIGGVAAARVTGTTVQHVGADGALLFNWSAFDHFEITDGPASDRTGSNVNWTHGNAIDLDADGNLLLSSRNLSEVTKINGVTGAVIWRMGGRRNQFTFVDSPSPAFGGQHSARVSGPGEITLLDNVGTPGESRGERYTIEEATRTARLARSYGSSPEVVTQIGGSVQRLAGGRTLVSFGTAGRVEEYDDSGRVMWRIDGQPGYVFRAQRIRSLYRPGFGDPR